MKLLASVLGFLTVVATTTNAQLDCSFRGEVQLETSPSLVLRQIANQEENTYSIELEYEGIAWLGFGSSPGGMIGSTAVIGRPDEDNTEDNRNPGTYFLGAFSFAGVTLLDEQLLTGGSIQQNETHTILQYTQPLSGGELIPVNLEGENNFVYAVGADNDISTRIHAINRRATFGLSQCREPGEDAADDEEDGIQVTLTGGAADEQAWTIHGYLMAISWGVLIPMGIGASLLRSLFPPGMFFRIHQVINSLAVTGTIAGFSIAVININKEEGDHFDITHMKIGLAVTVLAIFQASLAFFRPHLPHAPTDGDPTPAKSSIRTFWEYKHRILGTILLFAAWYACHSGIEQFAVKFGKDTSSSRSIFWGVAGGIAAVVIAMTVVVRMKGEVNENADAGDQNKDDSKETKDGEEERPPAVTGLSEMDVYTENA